jgi:hypothetical protein
LEPVITTLLDGPVQPAIRTHRRWWLWALAIVVAVVVAGMAIGAVAYAHSYSPLDAQGGSTGTLTPKTLKIETDGSTYFQYALVGPAGTVGSSFFTLTNTGRYRVKVLGTAASDPYTKYTVNWLPVDPGSDSPVGRARSFPATIGHGQAIAIQTTETQPNCSRVGVPGRTTFGTSLRWSALGVHHVLRIPGVLGSSDLPIMTCPPGVLRLLIPH